MSLHDYLQDFRLLLYLSVSHSHSNQARSIPQVKTAVRYHIAGFYCEHKFLRMIYLGHRRNTCGFYIYEYMVWTKLFRAHVPALVWCDISSSIAFIDVCFVCSGFYDQGNHVYKGIRDNHLGEELACRH